MKDGTVQQVAPPLEIYNAPANKFVAGFIGNPPMNFFEVAVKKDKDGVKLTFGKNGSAVDIEPPAAMKEPLLAYAGQNISMGVRPEDIYDKVYYQGSGKNRTLSATVEVVEPMGAEKYIYLVANGNTMVVRVSADNQAYVNQNIDVVFHLENAQFFNKDTEAVIH
jgi:multiple sugar transport system ATP-binding protein